MYVSVYRKYLTRHFLGVAVFGFVGGAIAASCGTLWWMQGQSIVRAAKAATVEMCGQDTCAFVRQVDEAITAKLTKERRFTQEQRGELFAHSGRHYGIARVPTSSLMAP